jgi:UbiD family decarboxylase
VLDLRFFLEQLQSRKMLQVIEDANWDEEIGAFSELVPQMQNGGPAVLFDRIQGYPEGYRLLVNSMNSLERLSLIFGLDKNPDEKIDNNTQFVNWFRKKLSTVQPIPIKKVSSGPVLENVLTGDDIDLYKFPVPKWHPLDGGRYIGTGDMVITRDPEEGWINCGTYRVKIQNKNSVGCYIPRGKHGGIHREKSFARGETWRVAICLGQHPLLFLGSCMEYPYGLCEMEFIGGLKGKPVKVIDGPMSGLPIPANAEIVLEGEATLGDVKDEGPFGEWMGYYGSPVRAEPLIKIKSILHRNNPILLGCPPNRPPLDEQSLFRCLFRSALIWDELEKAGVPDVKGVWCHREGGSRLFTVVAIKQRYPGHAQQAGLIATECHAGAFFGRFTIVVDEDIEPWDLSKVIWAMGTRVDPQHDVEIIRKTWSTPSDPIIPRNKKGFNSRMIIDACRPYDWKDEFAPVVTARPEMLQSVRDKMQTLGLFI